MGWYTQDEEGGGGEDGAEPLDVVDMHDRVLRVAPYAEVHAHNWIHRGVVVVLVSRDGRVLAQQRTADAASMPNRWTFNAEHVPTQTNLPSSCAIACLLETLMLHFFLLWTGT